MRELVFNFHGVGTPPNGIDTGELKYWLDERSFVSALDQISIAETEFKTRVYLTFDDGNLSDATIALPILKQRNLRARFFICAGRIGERGYLDKVALREMLAEGMSIGSHGMHHIDWRRSTDQELKVELRDARKVLEDVCNRTVDEVAIPFGSYDARVIRNVRRQNFRTVFTSDGGFSASSAWMKPRNTLTKEWQPIELIKRFGQASSLLLYIRRYLSLIKLLR